MLPSFTVENTFYSVVCPGMQSFIPWTCVHSVDGIEQLSDACSERISRFQQEEENLPKPTNFRFVYDSLLKLKSDISSSDIVDVIWLVPDLETKSATHLSVPADVHTASFLYLPLKSYLDLDCLVKITLLSTNACNDLLIWAKLLNASVYWTSPCAFPSHLPDSSSSETTHPAQTESLIIETPATLPAPKEEVRTSRLPIVSFDRVFEVSPSEMEIVCTRLLGPGIRSRCRVEWQMRNGSFLSYFDNPSQMEGNVVSCSLGVLHPNDPPLRLEGEKAIQLLNRFHPLEMARDLHVILGNTIHFSLVPTHPTRNELFSLCDSSIPAYFGCSVVAHVPAKSAFNLAFPEASIVQPPKEEVCVGILSVSSSSVDLYVVSPQLKQSLPLVTSLLLESFRHPQYCMVLDDDIQPQLTKVQMKNEDGSMFVIADEVIRRCLLMNTPSLFPPISHDLTLFSQRNGESCYEKDEELLNTISDLVDYHDAI